MAKAAEANGVKYICGKAGQVIKLSYSQDGTCTGAFTADGAYHQADVIILSAGAQIAALVEAKDEVEASASAVAVIELTPEEADKYKDIPIIDDFEQGRFDQKPRLIKDIIVDIIIVSRDHLPTG